MATTSISPGMNAGMLLPTQFGTPLTRTQNQIPVCTFGLSMRVLMWKTFTDFFGTMKNSYMILASSCLLTIAAAAFIHDIPNIVWGVEQIVTGSLSLMDPSVQWSIVHHIGMRYLRPLVLNLGRGFLLVLIGTLLFTGIWTLLKQYGRMVSYNQSRGRAIDHLQKMQQLITQLEIHLERADAKGTQADAYLEKELQIFENDLEKETRLGAILTQAGAESDAEFEEKMVVAKKKITALLPQAEKLPSKRVEAYKALEKRFCADGTSGSSIQQCFQSTLERMKSEEKSPHACQRELLKIAAYEKLRDIFCPDENSSQRIDLYFKSVLKTGFQSGVDPYVCLNNLFAGFDSVQFTGETSQLIAVVDTSQRSQEITAVALLYMDLAQHQSRFYDEIKMMNEVYHFNPPQINIELWQTQIA